MIIPSIDIMDGKAVQLKQGKEKILERVDVLDLAREFSKYGDIALIDLDAALGKGSNLELIKQICGIAGCRVGGGIRTIEKAKELLRAGARKLIIGTKASKEFFQQLPKDRLIAAIDSRDNRVVCEGWTKDTGKRPIAMIRELQAYCSEFLFTNINKEGLMQGCDFAVIEEIRNSTKNAITIAGGITTMQDIQRLEGMGLNSQVGMALYQGKLNLADSFISVLEFNRTDGLIPTIAQDTSGQVLMLAWSNKASLKQTFQSGKATYYSRARRSLWTKGETSGNTQEFIKARYDCDMDTLLFTVRQKNCSCHTGLYSCFGDKEFSMAQLYDVLKSRIENPLPDSYTSKTGADEKLIIEKIREESEELLNYKDKSNLIWEIADLSYFVLLLMAKKGITPQDIRNELWERRK